MISLFFYFEQQGFFGTLYARMQEGGIVSMTIIVLLFFLMLYFVVRAGMKLKAPHHLFKKPISLINQSALLALVIGLFNQLLGLIQVFDAFESLYSIEPAMFASGLKLTLLPPIFGGFIFIIGRTASFILNWIRDTELDQEVITV